MAVTALDPITALVVIDLQKGLMSYPTIHPFSEIIDKSRRLAEAFRIRGLPVVLVNVAGRAPGRLGALDDDILVTKRSWGAFPHTGLERRLRDAGATQVVITGIATSIGVESTAREAFALGFNVTLATDAITDMDEGAHENSISKIFPKLGETGTVEDILELLSSSPG